MLFKHSQMIEELNDRRYGWVRMAYQAIFFCELVPIADMTRREEQFSQRKYGVLRGHGSIS